MCFPQQTAGKIGPSYCYQIKLDHNPISGTFPTPPVKVRRPANRRIPQTIKFGRMLVLWDLRLGSKWLEGHVEQLKSTRTARLEDRSEHQSAKGWGKKVNFEARRDGFRVGFPILVPRFWIVQG